MGTGGKKRGEGGVRKENMGNTHPCERSRAHGKVVSLIYVRLLQRHDFLISSALNWKVLDETMDN